MPVLVPTPEEVAAMSPLQRQRARQAVARILRETQAALDDVVAASARREQTAAEWGRAVRDEARRMLADRPAEPESLVAARRAELLAAIPRRRKQC